MGRVSNYTIYFNERDFAYAPMDQVQDGVWDFLLDTITADEETVQGLVTDFQRSLNTLVNLLRDDFTGPDNKLWLYGAELTLENWHTSQLWHVQLKPNCRHKKFLQENKNA